MNELCRTCLVSTKSQDMHPLFNENISQLETESHDAADVLNKLNLLFTVQIDNNNDFPDKICIDCLNEIQRAYSFKLKCEKSQIILQQLTAVKVNLKQCKEDQNENEIQDERNREFDSQDVCEQNDTLNEEGEINSQNPTVQDNGMKCDRNNKIDDHLINVLQDNKLRHKRSDTINDKIDANSSKSTVQDNAMDSKQTYKIAKVEFVNDKKEENSMNTLVQYNAIACKQNNSSNAYLINPTDELNQTNSCIKRHQIVPSTHPIKKEPVDNASPDYCVEMCKTEPALDIGANVEDANWNGHDISNNEEFKCAACKRVFQSLDIYRDHIVTEHFEDKLCKLCNEEFECSQFEHITNHFPTNYFHQFDYEFHEFSDSKSESFQNVGSFCEHCLKHFHDLEILRLHVAVEHNARIDFNCRICSLRLPNNGLLSLHMKNVHNDEKPFVCELCQLQFQQWFTLKYHLRTNHAHEISAVNILQCQVCAKILPNKSRYAEHMRCHTGESPFQCNLCPEKFRYNKGLKSHMRKKHATEFTGGMQNYQCNICSRIFGYKDHLARHTRVHMRDKPFKCEICLKQFRCKRSCKLHTLTHIPSEIEIGMRRSARKSCTTTNE